MKGLNLQIFLDTEFGSCAADSRLLDASERRHLERDRTGVEADHAELQPLSDAPRTVEVGCVEIRGQSVGSRVGDLKGFLLVLESEKRSDRPEGLLVRQLHVDR